VGSLRDGQGKHRDGIHQAQANYWQFKMDASQSSDNPEVDSKRMNTTKQCPASPWFYPENPWC
jgi:hypothetical protein